MSGPDNESQLLALLKMLLEQIQQERGLQRQEFADSQLYARRLYENCFNSLLPYLPVIVDRISAWVSAPQAPAAHGPAAQAPAAYTPTAHAMTDLAAGLTLTTDQIQKIHTILSTDQLGKLSGLLSLAHRSHTPAAIPTPKASPSTTAKPTAVRHWFYPSSAIGCGLSSGLSINDLAAHELTCLREEVTCPGCLAQLQADRAICERCRLGNPHTRHSCGLSSSSPQQSKPVPLTEPQSKPLSWITTGIEPLDRVLAIGPTDRKLQGGLVTGGSFLVSGAPGAGKTTLLLQAIFNARRPDGGLCERLLYVNAEEFLTVIESRARRLRIMSPRIHALHEADIHQILARAQSFCPEILVIDSIQHVATRSGMKIHKCADLVNTYAKTTGTCAVLISCNPSEEPRTLHHTVDVMLNLDICAETPALRYLRCSTKNRFGIIGKVECLEMRDDGLYPAFSPPAEQNTPGV